MKNISKYLAAVLSLILAVACENSGNSTDGDGNSDPVISAFDPNVNYKEQNIYFKFNVGSSWKLEMSFDDSGEEWATVAQTQGSAGEFNVMIHFEENSSPEDRSATLVFTVGSQVFKEYTVTQSGLPPFDLSVSDITGNTATVAIAPHEADRTYIFDVKPTADIDKENIEDFVSLYIGDIYAQINLLQLMGQDVSFEDFLSVNEAEYTYRSLTPDTDTSLFCFYVDANGNYDLDSFQTEEFHTGTVVSSDMTIDITREGNIITITPSNDDEQYLYLMTKGSILDLYSDYNGVRDYMLTYYGNSLESRLVSGTQQLRYTTLQEGEEYVFVAAGYNGGFTTDGFGLTFTYEGSNSGDYTDVSAQYYGDYYETGLNNWYLVLYQPSVLSGGDGYGIALDLLANAEGAFADGLAPGTYTFSADKKEFSIVGSKVAIVDDGNESEDKVTSGSLVVAKSGNVYTLTLDVTGSKGSYNGTYTGEIEFIDKTASSDGYVFTGTGNSPGGASQATFYGLDSSAEQYNWVLRLYSDDYVGPTAAQGMIIQMDLYVDDSKFSDGIPCGTFDFVESGKDVEGVFSDVSYTRIVNYSTGASSNILAGESSVTISKSGSNYELEFNLQAEAGYKVTGTYSGAITAINQSGSSAEVASTKKTAILSTPLRETGFGIGKRAQVSICNEIASEIKPNDIKQVLNR